MVIMEEGMHSYLNMAMTPHARKKLTNVYMLHDLITVKFWSTTTCMVCACTQPQAAQLRMSREFHHTDLGHKTTGMVAVVWQSSN